MTVAEDTVLSRFADETQNHIMTILLDQGYHKHLLFKRPDSSEYWFELISVPGTLVYQGDMGKALVFRRLTDMFSFFRGKSINPHYWAEKLVSAPSARVFSPEKFRRVVTEVAEESVREHEAAPSLVTAVKRELFSSDVLGDMSGQTARAALAEFQHGRFSFTDSWEYDFDDYDTGFVWACYAIVWGIRRYDIATGRT